MEPKANPPSTTFVQPTRLRVLEDDGVGYLLNAQFSYDPADPYAVSLVIAGPDPADAPTTWTFARDLLFVGLGEPVGDGQVHVFPGESDDGSPTVLIELSDDMLDILLGATPADVEAFLAMTYGMVAPGQESDFLDVDAVIAAILDAANPDG
jgi:hypothetical protein